MTKRVVMMVLAALCGAVVYASLVRPTHAKAWDNENQDNDKLKLLVVVSNNGSYTNVPAGEEGNVSVECPAGYVVVTGGFDTGGSTAADSLSLNSDTFFFRGENPAGWQVLLTNKNLVNPIQLKVYATCAKGSGHA